ncbi:DoxX family protein [Pseudomonas sp. NA-150]|uniref:DoxX family protein n=1 Tax=Pseudomonas sp. NA-150 TaxID=3367525 RepID=UPI0037C83D01
MQVSKFAETTQHLGLLVLRISGSVFLLQVHGLPKLLNYAAELQRIEDPFHLGANLTLMLAIFAEVLCPLAIIAGVLARLACLPILTVLIIALAVVHPEWTLEQGQFGWLLLIIFTTVLIGGPGRFSLNSRLPEALRYA